MSKHCHKLEKTALIDNSLDQYPYGKKKLNNLDFSWIIGIRI